MKRLLSAEFLKLWLTPTTWWIIGASLLAPLAILLLIPVKDVHTAKDVAALLGWASVSGYVMLVFGAIGATTEYRHRTIVPTLLVAPQRLKVLSAQVLTYLLASLAVAVLSLLIVTAIVAMRTGFHSITGGALYDSYIGNTVYIVISALLGMGLGTLLKNQVATIAAIFVLFMLVGHVLPVLSSDLAKYTLDSIGVALSGGGGLPKEAAATLLSSLNAGLVYLAYAAIPLAIGFVRFSKTDIA